MRGTSARWLVAGTLAGFALLAGAQFAQAQTDATASNESSNTEATSGDATSTNEASTVVGPVVGGVVVQDIDGSGGTNVQEGDNEAKVVQESTSLSGDVIGGQVIGVVSAGNTTVNATNRSQDVDVRSGDATSTNSLSVFVGLATANGITIDDIDGTIAVNLQEGDNTLSVNQVAESSTGDAVGGQVIGVVTAAGGSADITMHNETVDADVLTGDAFSTNEGSSFVGLATGTAVDVLELEGGRTESSPDAGSRVGGTPTALASTLTSGGGTTLSSASSDTPGVTSDGDGSSSRSQTFGLVSSERGNLSTLSRAGGDDPAIAGGG